MKDTSIRQVLVVDDNPDDSAELRSLLLRGSDARHAFTDAASGADALRLLSERGAASFDCVLLDYHLTDMNAHEVLEQLCQPWGRVPCPVLVVTGEDHQVGRELMRAGAQDYIGKSWLTPHCLARAVDNAIERFAMQQEVCLAQLALARERERLAVALSAGQMGVYELNMTDGALSWSPEVYALFGLEPAYFVPTRASFRALVHPQDRAIPWQTLHDTGQPATHEFRILRPDGQWRWVAQRGQTTYDASRDCLHHAGVVFDITERRRTEAERAQFDQRLRDQQFYTRSLIEVSSDALVVTDPSGSITDANQHMETLTGRTRAELIGTPFANLFSEPAHASECLALALARRQLREHDELTLLAHEGRATPVSLNATTFFDRERVLQGVFFSARDVTERRFLDTALQETHGVLEAARLLAHQANERKSKLLVNMRKAMGEPLASISELAATLHSGPRLTATDQAGVGEDILRACCDLLEQIELAAGPAELEATLLAAPPRVMAGANPPA